MESKQLPLQFSVEEHQPFQWDREVVMIGGEVQSIRQFKTGATRNTDTTAHDFEGFLSPLVLSRFAEYMHKHRLQADGNFRSSDNWQKGIPLDSYMKSGWRHFLDWWLEHRKLKSREGLEEGLCALLFNIQGYLHETLKSRGYKQ